MALDTVNALTTLPSLKTWCSVTCTDFDDVLTDIINSVSIQFNNLTGKDLLARDITEQYTGDGSQIMLLPEYPINSITTIHIDTDKEFGATTEVTDFDYDTNTGAVVLDDEYFTTVFKANKIVYNAGYATIPGDLKTAAQDQMKWLFRRWRDNTEGVTGISMEGGNITMTEEGEVLKSSLKIIERYRKRDHGYL